MMTSKALTELGIHHFCVVEPQEVKQYKIAIEKMNLLAEVLELDLSYKDRYELCDDLGLTKSTGPGPARNFAWDHAIKNGFSWHWVMDDNIAYFLRRNHNLRIKAHAATIFRCMEDFCLRYKNVAMAGPNYSMFAFGASRIPPFIMNTRIYSCNLIRNDVPYRWRGRYNEDTILSLDMLTHGYCTIQFNAFLQNKVRTQTLSGGNTKEFYASEGTYPKSKMLYDVYPQYTKIVHKFSRIHHHVDYTPFKKNLLIRDPSVLVAEQPNEFDMILSNKSTKMSK